MKHKNRRQEKILEIIKDNNIETQDELTMYLNASGYKATQATVSRDIRELHLVKVMTKENGYRYEQREAEEEDREISSKARNLLRDSVLSVRRAQNLVIIRCSVGMAQAACTAIDSVENEVIVGSLAGDDTIFLATEDNAHAEALAEHLKLFLT